MQCSSSSANFKPWLVKEHNTDPAVTHNKQVRQGAIYSKPPAHLPMSMDSFELINSQIAFEMVLFSSGPSLPMETRSHMAHGTLSPPAAISWSGITTIRIFYWEVAKCLQQYTMSYSLTLTISLSLPPSLPLILSEHYNPAEREELHRSMPC